MTRNSVTREIDVVEVGSTLDALTSLGHYVLNLSGIGAFPQLAFVDPAKTPSVSLATLIANAAAGATVLIPDGVYREQVTLTKNITLRPANPGCVSWRGSDVWGNALWSKPSFVGSHRVWVSQPAVPALTTDPNGNSFTNKNPEQVFYDGRPLQRVRDGAPPQTGQFALDQYRRVILADNPFGHLVEVTTRAAWAILSGATKGGITAKLAGIDFRHAASQLLGTAAALRSNADGGGGTGQVLMLTGCNVYHAHGCGVGGAWAPGSAITYCDISENGGFGLNFNQDAFTPGGSTPVTLSNNAINNNNTLGYPVGFGAGGFKITTTDLMTCTGNTALGNNGVGMWWDISNTRITAQHNVSAYNEYAGLMFEISGARNGSGTITYTGTPSDISGNTVYECGWSQYNPFQVGGGILVSSSDNVNVHDNTVAWCWNPLAVWWDTGRGADFLPTGSGANQPSGIEVYANNVISEGSFSALQSFNPDAQLLKFLDQQSNHIGGAAGLYWNGGHNGAYANKFWCPAGDGAYADLFQYDGSIQTLATLNAVGTGGNSGGNQDSLGASTLIDSGTGFPVPAAVATLLANAGIPTSPSAGHGNAWNNTANQNPRIVHVTAAAYTASELDRWIIIDAAAPACTVTLPDVGQEWVSNRDLPITIINTSANTTTVQGTSSQHVNGAASATIAGGSNLKRDCVADGSAWWMG